MKENKVRIQDDLYQYVNGEWIKNAKIPSDLPVTGGFTNIMLDVEKILMDDFKAFDKKEKEIPLPILESAVKLYDKYLDIKARDEAGIKPLLPLLDKIKNIKDLNELKEDYCDLLLNNVNLIFDFDVMEDVRDTKKSSFVIMDPSIILPDKSLYDKKLVKLLLLKAYSKMVKKLLKYTNLTGKERKQYLNDTLAFDEILRKKVLSNAEKADYVKLFNPMSTDEACDYLSNIDFRGLLNKLYPNNVPESVFVGNVGFVKDFKDILNENTFESFKHWVYVNTLIECAVTLSDSILSLSHSYMYKVYGIKKEPTLEKQAFRLISSVYSEPIGLYYGRTYFGEKAKENIISIVKDIIETYKERMKKNTFLEESTKEKAILKLSTIKIKMGYPDKYDEFYDSLKLEDSETYFDALSKILKLRIKHKFDKLNKPTDFNEWRMPGHMVNACYDPFKNDITFPAAILKKPFYDVNQSLEENLGGIGSVIAHEISHAFDNNGAHFDENGCLKDWWKEEDFKKFDELTKGMVEQFDGIVYHGVKVNGKLVVSENIADNGGLAVVLQIMSKLDNPDYKAFFINYARIWCQKAQESYIKMLLASDEHSPSELRANITPRNFKEWYDTFDVKETDKMYIPEDKRIVIW